MNLGLHYKNQDHIFDEKEVNGVPFLSYPMLEETGIVNHGFSTRLGGVSKGCWATMNISTTRGDDPEDVRENQRRIAGAIGVQPEDMTFSPFRDCATIVMASFERIPISIPACMAA